MLQEPMQATNEPANPLSFEEAHWFHEGFLAGATAYAAQVGDSTLKLKNANLRKLFDEQGWKTAWIERALRAEEKLKGTS